LESRQVKAGGSGIVYTPAVVLALVGAGVIPVQVSLSSAMFSVVSFTAVWRAVRMMAVVAPLTI
jgi:hypothetical protein